MSVRQFNQTEIEAAKAGVSADDVNAANAEYYALRAELAALRAEVERLEVVRDAAAKVVEPWVHEMLTARETWTCQVCAYDNGTHPASCPIPPLGAALLRSAGGIWA